MATLIRQSTSRDGKGALYQGGMSDVLANDGQYDLVILCAMEWQPEQRVIAAPPVRLVYAPNDDSENPLTQPQLDIAIAAAREAAVAYREQKRVLISCMQGRNRSGLVSALTLNILYGMAGERCMKYIRNRVPHSLANPSFEDFLNALPAVKRGP